MIKKISLIVFTSFTLLACKKEPGIGGNGSISGSILTKKYNASFTQILGFYPGADHYVYIVFGDHMGYDKRIKSDFNGDFTFDFLYPGKYLIYTYSADSSGNELSGQVVIKKEIELGKNENLTTPRFVIYE